MIHSRVSSRGLLLLVLTLGVWLPHEGHAAPCQQVESGFGPKGTIPVRAETVVSGLEVPWGIAFLPNGDWLVTERPGRIRRIHDGRLLPHPVVQMPMASTSEGGLLGIAADPAFAKNRRFYVYVTVDENGKPVNQVQRWRLAADGASATQEKILIRIPASKYHDGGRLRFGPDGMLYIGTGDARRPDSSQDLSSPSGKLLRVTADGEVPKDNPFPGKPAFIYGIRNTEGFDWVNAQVLALADHGPSGEYRQWTGHDEVNFARAGANLGWPVIHGCDQKQAMAAPALTWVAAAPPGGAAIYRGDGIPEWKGSLLIGTLGSKHLHRVLFDPATFEIKRHEVYFEGDPPEGLGRLREVIMGPDGGLYVTTSNCDGRGTCPKERDKILRITQDHGPHSSR